MTLVATDITDELVSILQGAITRLGYISNIGSSVRVGEIRGIAGQAPACFVIPGRTSPADSRYHVCNCNREYEIKAIIDSLDHPGLSDHGLVDILVWDLRRCLESYEPGVNALIRRLNYRGDRPGYREEGGTVLAAAVTYEISYTVALTDPATPL